MATSAIPSWTYDVFLSFRGEDTRNSFTSHLYEALVQAGINTFRDSEELKRGMDISQELCEAIDGSRFLVVVFSKNYASSSWCLEELVRIMSCMECPNGQMVWPVFYDVDPSQVRKQEGIFGEAFTKHEERFKEDLETVQRWRKALTKATNLSGWHLDQRSESTLIKKMVQEILTKINRTLLTLAKNPVGIHSHIQQLKLALGIELFNDDVRMIGIYGLGGIGKTTIAKAVYNLIADRFEGCSFLPNIKERCSSSMHDGLVKLQESLLQDILQDKMHWLINFVDRGTNILRDRLRKKKVLIVLDDVDSLFHLEKLAGNVDWFGPGSRVIITTRNKQLLDAHGIDWTYKVDKLNHADAFELFCWNAFQKPYSAVNFEELSNVAVKYADGHPLTLTVVGASLCGCSKVEWESELQKLRRIPKKDVHEILKLSFDGLDDLEKAIFLDIASFFRGDEKERVMSFLDACGFYPESGIEVLIRKCLIYIELNRFEMHDLIQLMGREIVRQESPFYPGRRSRLWFPEDILQVLNENEGTFAVQGIFLNVPNVEVSLQYEAFSMMKKLRLLIIRNANVTGTPRYLSNELRWLEWPASSSTLPSTFHPKKLVVLNIQYCSVKELGTGLKGFENLRYLNFSDCEMLTEICDISIMPNLISLDLQRCFNLECFSSGLKSKSLKNLDLGSCYKLKKFPDILEEIGCLERLSLEASGIIELCTSIEKLTGLQVLNLNFCVDLVHLPSSIYRLKSLESLRLDGCFGLEKFPLPSNSTVISSSSERKHIQDLRTCHDISHHSTSGTSLTNLALRFSNLLELDFIMSFNCFDWLQYLYLTSSKFKSLPRGMNKFKVLETIILKNCKLLQDIPDLPPNIRYLDASGCESLLELDIANFFDNDRLSKNGYLWQDWTELCLYQGIYYDNIVEFTLPGNKIPNLFYYCSIGCPVLLQLPLHVKKNIKGIMLCAIYEMENSCCYTIQVEINSRPLNRGTYFWPFMSPKAVGFDWSCESDQVWIAYFPRESLQLLDEVLEDNTCHFEVAILQVKIYLHVEQSSMMKKCGLRLVFYAENEEIDF